ncbi:hypothetical protein Tco_0367362 [Tanacetum coccineum]
MGYSIQACRLLIRAMAPLRYLERLDVGLDDETSEDVGFKAVNFLSSSLSKDKDLVLRDLVEFDQAGDNVATTSYPFLAEAIVDPYAPLEVLLSKKPRSLHVKSAPSQSKSKPSSSKAANPDS